VTPVFDYIPVIGDRNAAHLRVITVSGVSTKHDSTHTQAGRMFGRITPDFPEVGRFVLEVFNDFGRAALSRILYGEATEPGTPFSLIPDNGSGLTARAIIKDESRVVNDFVMVVSFATDSDVLDAAAAARMPGFDPAYGLAVFHAQAMRTILASHLPEAVPHLYVGKNVSAFVPLQSADQLPDITTIRNADTLRTVQADMVKALSAQRAEHLEEFAEMAALARERVSSNLASIRNANPAPLPNPTTLPPGEGVMVQVGSFSRG
jgi:hypothetical protein